MLLDYSRTCESTFTGAVEMVGLKIVYQPVTVKEFQLYWQRKKNLFSLSFTHIQRWNTGKNTSKFMK